MIVGEKNFVRTRLFDVVCQSIDIFCHATRFSPLLNGTARLQKLKTAGLHDLHDLQDIFSRRYDYFLRPL